MFRQILEEPATRLRDFPRTVDAVAAFTEADAAGEPSLVGAVGKGTVVGAVGEDDHIAPIGEQRHAPGNVEADVIAFLLAGRVEGVAAGGQLESFGSFPVLDVGIFDDTKTAVFRA